ncbi:MAG: shikimate kinase [bacterium]|nr:shikimate kinase [bacterium]
MDLIVIFGPAAVGKTTVGYELQRVTGLRLFHNHMILEPIYNFFGFGDEQLMRLTGEFRKRLFEEFGKSQIPGIIFTYVWALDEQSDHDAILDYVKSMNIDIKDVLFIELEADQAVRINRNKSEFRLKEKKSKNNIQESENFLYQSEKLYKLNSNNDFFYPDQHIKINNTDKNPEIVAQMIKEELLKRKFELPISI